MGHIWHSDVLYIQSIIYLSSLLRDAYARAELYVEVSSKDEESNIRNELINRIASMSKEELLNLLVYTSKGKNLNR